MTDLTLIIQYARLAERKGDWTLAALRWRNASTYCHEAFVELYKENATACEYIAQKTSKQIVEPEMT